MALYALYAGSRVGRVPDVLSSRWRRVRKSTNLKYINSHHYFFIDRVPTVSEAKEVERTTRDVTSTYFGSVGGWSWVQ